MYELTDDGIVKEGKDAPTLLSNFTAEIKTQTKYHDGTATKTILHIAGKLAGQTLPLAEVTATEFGTMSWIPQVWGMEPIIYPMSNAERDVKTAIQINSKPRSVDVYTHIGWEQINGKPTYLTASGGITKEGLNPNINVSLPPELQRYHLPDPKKTTADDFLATVLLAGNLASPERGWPLLTAALRPLLGPADFAIHLSGKTGTYKSEIASLFQSLYGEDLDARHLPCSWSSTANALERQAFIAANALCTIDDFVPFGTAWQVRALQKSADQIIRAQGNQAGRARMNDRSNLQATYYPRGIILSTGEDTPTGHSIRARMMILEIAPGDVSTDSLTKAQSRRQRLSACTARYVQHIANSGGPDATTTWIKNEREAIRVKYADVGHSRTPSMIADLINTARHFLEWAQAEHFITDKERIALMAEANDAIIEQANRQAAFLHDTDPCEAFIETIKMCLATKLCHIRTKTGGIPKQPELLGWTRQESINELAQFKAGGQQVGWIDWETHEVLLDPNSVAFFQRHSQGKMVLTRTTLLKRLKEDGKLARIDEPRQRNTVRVTAQGHTRQVLVLPVSELFEQDELSTQ